MMELENEAELEARKRLSTQVASCRSRLKRSKHRWRSPRRNSKSKCRPPRPSMKLKKRNSAKSKRPFHKRCPTSRARFAYSPLKDPAWCRVFLFVFSLVGVEMGVNQGGRRGVMMKYAAWPRRNKMSKVKTALPRQVWEHVFYLPPNRPKMLPIVDKPTIQYIVEKPGPQASRRWFS